MTKDANAIFRSSIEQRYTELERLSALETFKGIRSADKVTLNQLVRYLDARGLWGQFAKITLGDLREAFNEMESSGDTRTSGQAKRKRKRRLLEDEFENLEPSPKETQAREPNDGGMTTEEVARKVLPFIEGNGEVTLEEITEYSRLDRKVLRHHLGALVKDGRLERLGIGRHAVYSTL